MVLELGGSDPFIVMPSTNLERATDAAVRTRCLNNGQSCIKGKRFFVHADIAEAFFEMFVAKMGALVVGDPMDETDVGPLATESGREDVEAYVDDAVRKGATVLVGGHRPDRAGWFYPPTVLTNITPDMKMCHEEVFGPVAQLRTVGSLEEALEIANGHPYGLGSNLWSEDEAERALFVRDVQSGMAFINGNTTSYPEIPFGGGKRSGYGREPSDSGPPTEHNPNYTAHSDINVSFDLTTTDRGSRSKASPHMGQPRSARSSSSLAGVRGSMATISSHPAGGMRTRESTRPNGGSGRLSDVWLRSMPMTTGSPR